MIYNLTDMILLKNPHIKRETVNEVLTAVNNTIIETVKENKSIVWSGLCTFTWKKKAKTKKEAQEWCEFPYKADGDKLRILPNNNIVYDDKEMNIKTNLRELKEEE